MNAREAFRHGRSLYRRGLREPARVVDERLTRSGRNPNGLRHVRPLCDQGTAVACRVDPRAITYLGRRAPERTTSVPRWHYRRDVAPMFELRAGGERAPVPLSVERKRRALAGLRGRLLDARIHGLTYTAED